ncbi:MAG: hypothetical protein IT204_24000 [Fimbriimonadaceae bacterium]|nr:hypothetical protein [Fimbriimonadaceae bacterium]
MQIAAEPTAPPPSRLWLWLPLLVYLLVFAAGEVVIQQRLRSHLRPGLVPHVSADGTRIPAAVPPGRLGWLLQQRRSLDRVQEIGLLGFPMLLGSVLLALVRSRDPLGALGLRVDGRVLLASGQAGFGAAVAMLLLILVLAGDGGGLREVAISLALRIRVWLIDPLVLASVPAVVLCCACARLLLPHGLALPLWRRRTPLGGALAVTVVFVLPFLRIPALSPLACGNVILLALLLERLRVVYGSLWPPISFYCGWLLVPELLGVPYQGVAELTSPEFAGVPDLLSGGAYGVDGGLLCTALLLLWLVVLLQRRPVDCGDA